MAGPTTVLAATEELPWLAQVRDPGTPERAPAPLVGALPGEGIGPEVVEAAFRALGSVETAGGTPVAVETGGPIGLPAEEATGNVLPDEVLGFCRGIFERGGAVLSGPGGGRYVYELRRRLGLFMKISPIQIGNSLVRASAVKPERLDGVDILVLRENLGGIYQGRSEASTSNGGLAVEHRFAYGEAGVRSFMAAATRLARSRRGGLTVVLKQSGLPELSGLWRECALDASRSEGVEPSFVDVDLLAYRMVDRPADFDVIAASNLFGDVIGDLAAVLLGSRGLSFGASYSRRGHGVYQTNHGAAHDIAGSDRANPVGQILSLAMLLRESLELPREAAALEQGVRDVWSAGHATADLGGSLGTAETAARVGAAAAERFAALA